jgi:ectoine hydroxylase-related dioxygenase (phytanoyl-CoA dioxygenase family)
MATDFSSLHDCVSDLFPKPKNKDEWDQYRLSEDQVNFFREQGYLSGVQLLNENQIEHLRTELTEFFEKSHEGQELWYEYHTNESSDPSRTLFHALGAWRLRKGFHDILWNPAFVVPASQLLEGSVRFWHDQLFCKPAKHGGNVAWHQDYSYWTRTKPMAHLTCWIGLDPATKENGCLQYIPGSQDWELLPMTELAGDMDGIKKVLNEQQFEQFQKPIAIELEAGQCSFHHPLMVHGSHSNSTEIPRRATVINVIRDGVESYTDETLLNGVPVIPKGQKMDGQFFPLLYDVAN